MTAVCADVNATNCVVVMDNVWAEVKAATCAVLNPTTCKVVKAAA